MSCVVANQIVMFWLVPIKLSPCSWATSIVVPGERIEDRAAYRAARKNTRLDQFQRKCCEVWALNGRVTEEELDKWIGASLQ